MAELSTGDETGHTQAVAQEPPPFPDIPLTHRPGAFAGSPRVPLAPLASRKTVLVVEDEPMMLEMLMVILRDENYEVVPAASPQAAIAAVDSGLIPDLLITDVVMPGLTGIALAAQIRERAPEIPVLYETGFCATLFADRPELEAGASFLEKPFTPRGLQEAARLALFGRFNP